MGWEYAMVEMVVVAAAILPFDVLCAGSNSSRSLCQNYPSSHFSPMNRCLSLVHGETSELR